MRRESRSPALREDDLEDLAGDDLLFRVADHLLEIGARDARRELGVGSDFAGKASSSTLRGAQPLDGAVEPRVRLFERRVRVGGEELAMT